MPRLALLCVLLTSSLAHAGVAARSTITLVSVKSEPAHDVSDAPAKKSKAPVPAAELVALNSHESFELRPGPQGGFGSRTMRALARFLRCHHTQKIHAMSERLARLLYTTASHFEFARLEIVAGYRAPKVARAKGNPKSPHKRGVACDFRVAGVANEIVRDYVRTLPRVGVGFYPNSGFVHLDVRDKQSAFWVDYSKPGERAKYSSTPEDDVRRLATPTDISPEGEDTQGDERQGDIAPNLPALLPSTPQEDK